MARYVVSSLPAIQRDLYLSRCLRRVEDAPTHLDTFRVEWADMAVVFAADTSVAEASVEVEENISLLVFTRRLESLLDCGSRSQGTAEWVLKFSAPLWEYGGVEQARRLLCDKVASIDSATGETVGVLKIKRRSVQAGHAKVRLVPAEDLLQVIVRHISAQGLKAVWKSLLWRLRPQEGTKVKTQQAGPTAQPTRQRVGYATIVTPPCVAIESNYYSWTNYIEIASRLGARIDVEEAKKNGLNVVLPLEANGLKDFGLNSHWDPSGFYKAAINVHVIPPGIPKGFEIDQNGNLSIQSGRYAEFREKAMQLSAWLKLGWDMPPVPAS